jgi:hypothetical protein
LLVVLLGVLLPPLVAFVPLLLLVALLVRPTEVVARRGRLYLVEAVLTLTGFLAALSAPFRAAAVAVHRTWEPFPAHLVFDAVGWLGPRPVAGLDVAIGLCGILLGAIGGCLGVRRTWRQARQIENLPTSRARSAAIGLAEFKGVARAADPPRARQREEATGVPGWAVDLRHLVLFTGTATVRGRSAAKKKWSAFYLEDETGRILVDPRDARFWDGHGGLLLESIRTIHLEPRYRKLPAGHEVTGRLAPGDPVYLIGSVEPDPEAARDAADSDRLVVRPRPRPATGLLDRLLLLEDVLPGGDAQHVFFLSSTPEHGAAALLRRAAAATVLAAFVWLVASSWLVTTRQAEYASLPAGLLSPEVHERREERRRSEVLRFIARVTPESAGDVPRLIEALGDPALQVRKEAVLALYRVRGAPRPRAVIPVLIELLRWQDPTTYDQPTRNGAALRLGELGPMAAPAIPALVESLGHRDALVRYHALRGLAGIGVFGEPVVQAFARALADPAPAVRFQAVLGLEQMGSEARAAALALERAQRDADPEVRERARRLLQRLAG